jgi:hypothetical protein
MIESKRVPLLPMEPSDFGVVASLIVNWTASTRIAASKIGEVPADMVVS